MTAPVKRMTLAEYQVAARSTALPAAYDYEYLIPGILSEVGELYGKMAKAHRDGWKLPRLQEELTKELGDVCWNTAILLDRLGVTDEREFAFWINPGASARSQFNEMYRRNDPITSSLEVLNFFAQRVFSFFGSGFQLKSDYIGETPSRRYFIYTCVALWDTLKLVSVDITGHGLDYVLGMNLAKLSSRQLRGTIEGSGDDR